MIFVDTSAWAAISLSKDRYHKAATRFQTKLRRSREELLTSNFIMYETLTLLLSQAGYLQAIRFYNILQVMIAAGVLRLHHVTGETEEEAWQIFRRFNVDKEWSFTDCTSKAIMEATRTTEVFTFDHHFDQMGFLCVPGPTE